MSMLSLKDLLSRNMKKSGIGRQLEANQVLHATVKIVEEWLSSIVQTRVNARGEYFKQATVFITVPSGIMAQELRINEQRIVDQVNTKLGGTVVKRLHVFVGSVS